MCKHMPTLFPFLILQGEFVDDGTETHFTIGPNQAHIKAVSSGKRRDGIVHKLFVNESEIPLAKE